jgi:hypothetical protein
MRSVDRILKGAKPADLANAVVFDGARVGTGALVAAGSVVYPKTRIAPRTVFRNSASGNHPTIEPVGRRMRRWQATSYRRIVRTYLSGRDDGAPGRILRRGDQDRRSASLR